MSEVDTRIENCSVTVKQMICDDGEMEFVVSRSGDVPLSTYIGLLELAKLAIAKES